MQSTILAKDTMQEMSYKVITSKGKKVINGSALFSQHVGKMKFQLLLDFQKPDKTTFRLLDWTFDGCEFLKGNYNKINIAKYGFNLFRNQNKFIKRCPVEKVCLD